MDDSSFCDRILSNLHFQRSYQRAGDTLCVRVGMAGVQTRS
jgi:hypothetical protein